VEASVDWSLAERVARDVARDGDRAPDAAERTRLEEALRLAEHWLDAGGLPAAADVGRSLVLDRDAWIDTAIVHLRRIIDPIAQASTDALVGLATRQFSELQRMLEEDPDALDRDALGLGALGLDGLDLDQLDLSAFGLDPAQAEQMRAQLQQLLGGGGLPEVIRGALDAMTGAMAAGTDPGRLLRPAAASLNALQAGQVIGTLARQVHGHRDLGLPSAPGAVAGLVATNIAETFEGYGLDPTEVAILLAVTETAHRRLHHAVGWLDGHLVDLVTRFARATTVDETQLRGLAEQLEQQLDPDDPTSFARAMERAGRLRLEPNDQQRPILDQLRVVIGLTGAWARHEARTAVADRLPALDRLEEVLRRRRATAGDGELLLADLLGLDLRLPDETVAERFVATVLDVLGSEGLRRALAHPENLPDAAELADPGSWLGRTVDGSEVPDDVASLFDGSAAPAPREASAEERRRDPGPTGTDGPPDGPAEA
jgi:putative hydrolase